MRRPSIARRRSPCGVRRLVYPELPKGRRCLPRGLARACCYLFAIVHGIRQPPLFLEPPTENRLIRIHAPVAQERPIPPRVFALRGIALHHQHFFLVARRLRHHAPKRIRHKRIPPKLNPRIARMSPSCSQSTRLLQLHAAARAVIPSGAPRAFVFPRSAGTRSRGISLGFRTSRSARGTAPAPQTPRDSPPPRTRHWQSHDSRWIVRHASSCPAPNSAFSAGCHPMLVG